MRSNPSSAMQWISHMQLAVTSRAKHCKKSIWLKALCSLTIAPSIHTIQVFDLKLKWNEHSLSFSFSSFGRFLFCWQKSLLSRFSKDLSVFKKKEKTEEKKRKFLLPIFFTWNIHFFTFSIEIDPETILNGFIGKWIHCTQGSCVMLLFSADYKEGTWSTSSVCIMVPANEQ